MKSKGFSIHVDGHEKNYPAGATVPAGIIKKFGLVAKGLVEPDGSGDSGGVDPEPSNIAPTPPEEETK